MGLEINWVGYQYREYDGYGRFANRMIKALCDLGVRVHPTLWEYGNSPRYIQDLLVGGPGGSGRLTISCMPPYYLLPVPGPLWALTMTEGTGLPDGWASMINESGADRLLVPCAENAETFAMGGVTIPIHILHGGTDPDEFAPIRPRPHRPYTFMAMGDRGSRKGWVEVYQAFYKAFGTPRDVPDVRLIIKSRPDVNELLTRIRMADNLDPRIEIWEADVENPRDMFKRADCVCLPSRHEGWGMPHREAAMMGLPVIVTRRGGLADGSTEEWAIVIDKTQEAPIPSSHEAIAGMWAIADIDELAQRMRELYDDPGTGWRKGAQAREWLSTHQTWAQAAQKLVSMILASGYKVVREHGVNF